MAKRQRYQLLLTCEHGGNRVPPHYARLFRGHADLLHSHRGYDLGSLTLARTLAHRFGAELISSTVTRLLIELNRSPRHPRLFSPVTRGLSREAKRELMDRYYLPHRDKVLRAIAARVASDPRPVFHLAVHTFTPVLAGVTRNADIGLLYDPARGEEGKLCHRWNKLLTDFSPTLRVRMNYPYRGATDGLTTSLRRIFKPRQYIGIELEANQGLLRAGSWPENIIEAVTKSLREIS